MPTVIRTTPEVNELFTEMATARGLDTDRCPAAVRMAVVALSQGAVPFTALLEDLPAQTRAWEWMQTAFEAFAAWCGGTVVTDDELPPD